MIDAAVADAALAMLEVDAGGLDRSDRALLDVVASKFAGGPVGLSTLAVAIGEEADTIEDVLEPYLLQQGLLKRTPRGRVITPRALTAAVGITFSASSRSSVIALASHFPTVRR